jgi:hypothetical protein
MLFQHRPYFIVNLVGYFLYAGEIPGLSADRAIHFIVGDFMSHYDFGEIGNLASMPLMTESGSPLYHMDASVICWLLSLGCLLLFG